MKYFVKLHFTVCEQLHPHLPDSIAFRRRTLGGIEATKNPISSQAVRTASATPALPRVSPVVNGVMSMIGTGSLPPGSVACFIQHTFDQRIGAMRSLSQVSPQSQPAVLPSHRWEPMAPQLRVPRTAARVPCKAPLPAGRDPSKARHSRHRAARNGRRPANAGSCRPASSPGSGRSAATARTHPPMPASPAPRSRFDDDTAPSAPWAAISTFAHGLFIVHRAPTR